jgi:hypothetical protein
MIATIAFALLAAAQDPAALLERLKSKDADEVENAVTDLLKAGGAAIRPLRDAAAASADADFRKRASGTADRIETRLAAAGLAKNWGDRWYAVYISAVHVGWLQVRIEEKDGKVLVHEHLHVQPNKNTVFEVKASLTCEPNEYLTPTAITLDIASPEHTVSATAQLKDGRLVVKTGGDVKAHRVRPNLVVDLTVFPLVTLLPRTEGFEVEVLALIKPKLPAGAVLKFDKEQSVDHGGRKVKAKRFVLADGESPDKYYYVDAEGQLLRVEMTGDDSKEVEIVLADEKKAKDTDTKD